jgi:hypothetical protein
MANKKIGDVGEDLVLIGAGIAGFFLVLKPLLNIFQEDPQDKASIQNQKTIPPASNVFSPQYAPFVANFNANPSIQPDGSVLTMQQFWQVIKANNDAGQPTMLNGVNIAGLGESLLSALSAWVLATDSNAVFGVFTGLPNKTAVAGIAAYLYYNYGIDLLTALTGSIFKVGLSPADLATLINQVNNLPE